MLTMKQKEEIFKEFLEAYFENIKRELPQSYRARQLETGGMAEILVWEFETRFLKEPFLKVVTKTEEMYIGNKIDGFKEGYVAGGQQEQARIFQLARGRTICTGICGHEKCDVLKSLMKAVEGQIMKKKLWIREYKCGHERPTNVAFVVGIYEKPKVGGVGYCRECMSETVITGVREVS